MSDLLENVAFQICRCSNCGSQVKKSIDTKKPGKMIDLKCYKCYSIFQAEPIDVMIWH